MNDCNSWINAPITIAVVSGSIPTILVFALNYFTNKKLEKNKKEAKDNQKSQDERIYELNEKLNERLIKEVEIRKDLERQKEKVEESLKWSRFFQSDAKKDRKKLKKENTKLRNERDQLELVLSWYNFDKRDIDKVISGNIETYDWVDKPEIQKIKGEIVKKRCKCEDYLKSIKKDEKNK